jgi:hypothetical protein
MAHADVASAQRGRLYDQRAATVLYEICCAAPTVTICDVSGSLKKRWAPVRKLKRIGIMRSADTVYATGAFEHA